MSLNDPLFFQNMMPLNAEVTGSGAPAEETKGGTLLVSG